MKVTRKGFLAAAAGALAALFLPTGTRTAGTEHLIPLGAGETAGDGIEYAVVQRAGDWTIDDDQYGVIHTVFRGTLGDAIRKRDLDADIYGDPWGFRGR